MPRYLVVGGSGLVGRRLLCTLGRARATGTYHTHPIPDGVQFDMTTGKLDDLLGMTDGKFTHLIILSAISNIDRCARDPIAAARVNVTATCRMADDAAALGLVPIFASSDAVYDGSRRGWRENDDTHPILVYGRQKLEAEDHLVHAGYPALILRIAKVLDPELDASGVLGPWLKDLSQGRLIRCATDQYFTPVGVGDLATAIARLAEAGATGTFNVGGESTSRIELLEKMIEVADAVVKTPPKIERCRLGDFPFLEKRPLDLRMSLEKLERAIGYSPESFEVLCRRAARNFVQEAASQA